MAQLSARKFWPVALPWLILVVVVCVWWIYCAQPTTVLLLRHGDKLGNQDQLSPAGQARAQELVHVAQKAGVAAIYHSEFQRTRQTAEPLANVLGLVPVQFAAADVQLLVDDILQQHRGATVLVVGHSDSIPQVIAALGGPTLANLASDEFDNLFVLTRCRCWWSPVRLVNLQYGAASP